MISTINVAGATLSIVTPPSSPGFRTVEFTGKDAVAVSRSPFTGQTQTYQWPGAEEWRGTMTLPLLTQAQAAQWKAFLFECRGMSLPFLLGDPLQTMPFGNLQESAPEVDNSPAGSNQAAMTTLATKNWTPGKFRVLLPGDYLQVGYRLHMNMDAVNTDSNGKAVLSLWPSLRELPVDGSAIVFKNPVGLFRRADNEQTWSATVGRLTSLSFQIMEYR